MNLLTSIVYGWLALGGLVACATHSFLRKHNEPGLNGVSWCLVVVLWPILIVLLSFVFVSRQK